MTAASGIPAMDRERIAREEQKRVDELAVLRLQRELAWLMETARGRRLVFQLLRESQVFEPTADTDPYATYFNEGKRFYGVRMMRAVMAASPEAYVQMLTERMLHDDDGVPLPGPSNLLGTNVVAISGANDVGQPGGNAEADGA